MRTGIGKLALLGLALLGLAACTTSQDMRRRDEALCTGYGFTPGTPEFGSCLQRESLARRYGYWPGWPSPNPWW